MATAVGAIKQRKILVLDDSDLIRELVRETLQQSGYAVVTVDTPIGFTNLLRKEQPDLALVDVMIPGLSGDKLAEIAIRRGASCPIVLFSDRPAKLLAGLVKSTGVAGYICKTSDMDSLVKSIERFFEQR
jgi:DNA-binding response OmpR family regulator